MAETKFDNNKIPALLATLNTIALTPTLVKVNPTGHLLMIEDSITGSDFGKDNAGRDENNVPVIMAVSSADGITPISIYADSLGRLLIQST